MRFYYDIKHCQQHQQWQIRWWCDPELSKEDVLATIAQVTTHLRLTWSYDIWPTECILCIQKLIECECTELGKDIIITNTIKILFCLVIMHYANVLYGSTESYEFICTHFLRSVRRLTDCMHFSVFNSSDEYTFDALGWKKSSRHAGKPTRRKNFSVFVARRN